MDIDPENGHLSNRSTSGSLGATEQDFSSRTIHTLQSQSTNDELVPTNWPHHQSIISSSMHPSGGTPPSTSQRVNHLPFTDDLESTRRLRQRSSPVSTASSPLDNEEEDLTDIDVDQLRCTTMTPAMLGAGPTTMQCHRRRCSCSQSPSNSIATDDVTVCSSTRLVYTSDRHALYCFESMEALRKRRELCDVILRVGGREIAAHRLVLAVCSEYFRAMFTGELAESRQTEITLYDLDGDAVESLVAFCYTSRIVVHESNVQSLLPAACLLQLVEIQDVACEFLKRQLDPTNCLGIRAFADTHACRNLLRVADRFAQLKFLEVVDSEEFLLLPINQLIDLVSSEELNVRTEEQVYRAVMRWMHHNLNDRKCHLPRLLQHIRLPLLSPKFLVGTVGSDLLIRSDDQCRDLVDEAKNYLLLPQERALMQGPRTKPRKPLASNELLYAVGGWCSGDAIASAEHYDSTGGGEWRLVQPMSKRRCGVGVGVLSDLLYAVGGHDGQSYLNSVERYDPHTNQWSSDIAPTSTCRTSVGVAVLDDFMYAVGGQDGVSCLSFVERFDPNVNRWTKVASMASRRLGVGVAVLNNQLYAVGGSNGQQPLASVEHFDPRVGNWHRLPCMGVRRKHLGVAVYNNLIYAVGGRDEMSELSSCECFDLRALAWLPVVAMTSRRSGVGLAVVNNQLIAIGGFDGASYLKSIEAFNPDDNCWQLRPGMNSRRLGGGVGVVRLASASNWDATSPPRQPVAFDDPPDLFETTSQRRRHCNATATTVAETTTRFALGTGRFEQQFPQSHPMIQSVCQTSEEEGAVLSSHPSSVSSASQPILPNHLHGFHY